jgi:hypothetical protein
METMKAIGEYDNCSDLVVVAGSKNEIPADVDDKKLVLHGNCTRRHLKDHPDAMFIFGCPPAEPCLYMTMSTRSVVDGSGSQFSEYLRPRMAADQPVWRAYVEERAKEFYGEEE